MTSAGNLRRFAADQMLALTRKVNTDDQATVLICTHDGDVGDRGTRRITLEHGRIRHPAGGVPSQGGNRWASRGRKGDDARHEYSRSPRLHRSAKDWGVSEPPTRQRRHQ